MNALDLEPDCDSCVALCCVAAGFESSPDYSFSKPAGQKCHLLDENYRCTIHDAFNENGLSGCGAYTCFGAGQVITRRYFLVEDWRVMGDAAQPVFDRFYAQKELHELIWVLRQVQKTGPAGSVGKLLAARIELLEARALDDGDQLAAADVNQLREDSQIFVDAVAGARERMSD